MHMNGRRYTRRPPIERHRFMTDRSAPGGCWIWLGSDVGNSGYARFNVNWQRVLVHRWAYETFVGPIAPGQQVDHLCNVKLCSNPAHLRACSPRENTLRCDIAPATINARKTECLRGHPFDEDNTFYTLKGYRQCRACRNVRARESKARLRRAA